jgi:hypothetical protein
LLKSFVAYNKKQFFPRPICLPIQAIDTMDYLTGDILTMSGWGNYHLSATTVKRSDELKFAKFKVSFVLTSTLLKNGNWPSIEG